MKINKVTAHVYGATIALMLLGCAAGMVATTQRIQSTLSAKQYNDLASKYYDRPTFVNIETMHDGSKVLSVMMDAYGTNQPTIKFYSQDAAEYIAAIDKFLAWETQALANKDMIEKEIAVIPSPTGVSISFDFTSGNTVNHYLNIGLAQSGLLGQIKVPLMTLDRVNAEILRQLLVDLPTISAHVRADDYK